MIGDGFGPAMATFTRTLKGSPLAIDGYVIGTVSTKSANRLITDSAAAATAMATGVLTKNRGIGIFENGTAAGTILEAAIEAGVSCGMVVTSPIHHATPAGFSAHANSRYSEDFITKQQLQKGIKVMFGGGANYYNLPDNRLLAEEMGYHIINDTSQLNSTQLPALGVFAYDGLPFEVDRLNQPEQFKHVPSLLEMATRALELFKEEDNEKGFFLLIEGSEIDWAGHNNDPVAMYYESLQLDQTFEMVMEFAKKDNDTLVILTADHETGGLGIGYHYSNDPGDPYSWEPQVILKSKGSSEYIANKLLPLNGSLLYSTFTEYTGIIPSVEDKLELDNAKNFSEMYHAISLIVSKTARMGWTTDQHTAIDVNMVGYGPLVTHFCGNQHSNQIATKIANIFEWDLELITSRLRHFNTTP
uniref:Alkaline phosphatase n=1 Tax=Arcella intermedia TaxID=1963864 RepID=A0A6B2L4N0_9EUKA